MALGDVVTIDDHTLLVLGQELDVATEQPDAANSLVHRAGNTLVVVDTGVTTAFRDALLSAIGRVGPYERAVVLTTHGHTDHIGNNDLADELGVPTEHYVPARDLPQMLDPTDYWTRTFARITGVAPVPAPPALVADKIVSMFQPLRPFARVTRTYEELPLERITIGSVRATGWTFADGAVRVVRSQGHCAGHVVVHLRDSKVLHLADEGNAPCAFTRDSDQLKLQTIIGAAATMLAEGSATVLTDGHTFGVRRGAEAEAYLDGLLDQAVALHEVALSAAGGLEPVRPSVFAETFARGAAEIGVAGANPNPMFSAMTALNELGEIGLRPQGTGVDEPWSRPALVEPTPPSGAPHGLALIPAAVAMLGWKLHKRDR